MDLQKRTTGWLASLALLVFGAAGCGVEVNAPGPQAEQCLGENPDPSCENKEQPTDAVIPADRGVEVEFEGLDR